MKIVYNSRSAWLCGFLLLWSLALLSRGEEQVSTFQRTIEAAKPDQHWSFDEWHTAAKVEKKSGPTSPEYPLFDKENPAAKFKNGGHLVIPDPGEDSLYDFDNGDEITVEAMVQLDELRGQAALLTKGRTNNPGVARDNQNWAFRLKSTSAGLAGVNFLFRSRSEGDHKGNWHRWTSTSGFGVGTGWHHVAISYRFGDPKSIRGYIDGKPVQGSWDMGGETTAPPVVDNDEVWIGSSLAGNLGNSLFGSIDEIALYRRVVPASEFKNRYQRVEPEQVLPKSKPGILELSLHPWENKSALPINPKPALDRWEQSALGFVRLPRRYDDWGVREDWGKGVMVRAVTEISLEAGDYEFLGRSRGVARLFVDGERLMEFQLPNRGGGAHNQVQPVPEVPRLGMRPHALDDMEMVIPFTSAGGTHTIVYDVMVGGPGLRLEFGEGCLAIAKKGEMFHLVGRGQLRGPALTDQGWERFAAQTSAALWQRDRATRLAADKQGDYWSRRHELAVAHLVSAPQESGAAPNSDNRGIDQLIAARIQREKNKVGDPDSFFNKEVSPILAEHCFRCHGEKEKGGLNLQIQEHLFAGGDSGLPAVVPGKPHESLLMELVNASPEDDRMPPKGDGLNQEEIETLRMWIAQGGLLDQEAGKSVGQTPVVDDLTFLRRIWLDTVGFAPPLAEVREFLTDTSPNKRERMVDRLLAEDGWADNWVGYWQDVLAENPNLLKPNLNNTGPFRYWILEALRDNKPLDRFATEVISMRGSTWDGGPAGFSQASQNDVPMAAKAHILSTAFLAVDMKCARCHDAPYHQSTQQDLFSLAAMLNRKAIQVPKSSSVPDSFFEHVKDGGRESLIEVSLPIGSQVAPDWPFDEFSTELPEKIIQDDEDSRERIASRITFSRRFAEVMANRIWTRFMGAGIVEKVDDWEGKKPSDPELLAYLADELIRSGYDLKSLSRLIFQSEAYQREAVDRPENLVESERFFEGPYRRRMTAEQVVDNAWKVSGQEMDLGYLTMDREGRLRPGFFMNFGEPKRAWEFTTLANERDRPSLAMPRMQAIVDVLLAFGWRNSRQEPTSHRIEEPNPLQPGVLANGVMGAWLTRLTDDSEVTKLCLESDSVEQLTEDLYLRFLTRFPSTEEKERFEALLSDGFDRRIVAESEILPAPEKKRYPFVSWMNHLDSEANSIMQEQEEDARNGEPPTRFLHTSWREQAEDALWALLNAPEMIVVP